MAALGAEVQLRMINHDQPYLTDENNHILDRSFAEIVERLGSTTERDAGSCGALLGSANWNTPTTNAWPPRTLLPFVVT